MAEGIALEGMRLVKEYLPRAIRNGSDVEARLQMLVAPAWGQQPSSAVWERFVRSPTASEPCMTRIMVSFAPAPLLLGFCHYPGVSCGGTRQRESHGECIRPGCG